MCHHQSHQLLHIGGHFLNPRSSSVSWLLQTDKNKASTLVDDSTSLLLNDLNNTFLDLHRKSAEKALHNVSHAVIYLQGKLSLWQVDEDTSWKKIETATIHSEKYNTLKNIAHIPATVSLCGCPMYQSSSHIHAIKSQLLQIQISLMQDQTNESALKHSHPLSEMIHRSLEFLHHLEEEKEITIKAWEQYEQRTRHLTDSLLAEGAYEALSQLEGAMQQWMESHRLALTKTRVLIAVPHSPRQQLAEMQYFLKLYAHKLAEDISKIEDKYVICAEYLPQEDQQEASLVQAMKRLLSSTEVNRHIAKTVLGSPAAMDKDILAEKAEIILQSTTALDQSAKNISQAEVVELKPSLVSKSKCPMHK